VSNAEQQHPFDEIAVYALDGLEPDEQAAVEAHLAGCLVCQVELDGHLATLARLTPDEPASPALWARIAESIAAEAGAALGPPRPEAVPYPGGPPVAEPRRRPAGRRAPGAPGAGPRHLARRRRPWERIAGLAAAAVVLLAAALGIGYLVGDRGEDQPDLADQAEDAIDAGDPVATLATPDGAAVARVVVTDTGGYFLADELPTLEEGRTYQLWQLDGDQPISLGTVGDGTTAITPVAVPAGTTTMAEVAGGAVSPTPDQIIASGEAA
jgi:Anti-sigma-K factor rskA/Putative zinc-finger